MSDPVPGEGAGDEPLEDLDVDLDADEPDEPDEPEEGEGEGEDEGGEGDGGGEESPEPAPRSAKLPTRGQRDFQRLTNENRELKTKQAVFEAQLRELTAARAQPSPAEQAAAAEAERQRYEMMSPYEQFQYAQSKIQGEVQRQTNAVASGLWEQNDQRDYDALLKDNPAYRRLDDRVKELKTQAPAVSRRILLATAIGLRALEQGGAARTRTAKAAEAGAARQNARPSNGRGDAAAQRTQTGNSLENRLRNARI